MNPYSSYYASRFDYLYVEPELLDHPAIARARRIAPSLELRSASGRNLVEPPHQSERALYVRRTRGRAYGRCPGTRGHRCCNLRTLDLYVGCRIGCTYCIMQSYLTSSAVTVQLDAPADLADIRADAVSQPLLNLRVGTGEVGDSLELDPLFDCSRVLIEGLADLPNVTLELKTKTSFVDHLLDITAKGRTVISFSLNPPELAREEPRAAPVRERLRAAKRASDAGYRIAFHFDPIIASGEWKTPYAKLIDELGDFAVAPPAWVSLGTVRFPPSLREKMQPRSYLFDEYVPCRDGKFRYLQKRRIAVYRQMKEWIEKRLSTSVYLCMESETVWREVFGSTPEHIENLVGIFDEGGDGEYEV